MSKNVFSDEGFIEWLEKQPPDGEYRYFSYQHCLVAQYIQSIGLTELRAVPRLPFSKKPNWRAVDKFGREWDLPRHWMVAAANIGWSMRGTYGGALREMREFAMKRTSSALVSS